MNDKEGWFAVVRIDDHEIYSIWPTLFLAQDQAETLQQNRVEEPQYQVWEMSELTYKWKE